MFLNFFSLFRTLDRRFRFLAVVRSAIPCFLDFMALNRPPFHVFGFFGVPGFASRLLGHSRPSGTTQPDASTSTIVEIHAAKRAGVTARGEKSVGAPSRPS